MDIRSIHPDSGKYCPVNGTMNAPILMLGQPGGVADDIGDCLRQAGWRVIRPPRPTAPASDADGAALAGSVRALPRRPAGIVAMFGGGFRPGRLLDHDCLRLVEQLNADVTPHLIAARHLLPVLAESDRPSTYLILGGPGADSPWSGYGHVSVAAAALRSLTRALNNEMHASTVRVRQLSVCTPIRTDSNRDHACSEWPNGFEVGHRIAELLDSPPAQTVVCMERRRHNRNRLDLNFTGGSRMPSSPSPESYP